MEEDRKSNGERIIEGGGGDKVSRTLGGKWRALGNSPRRGGIPFASDRLSVAACSPPSPPRSYFLPRLVGIIGRSRGPQPRRFRSKLRFRGEFRANKGRVEVRGRRG